MKKFIFIICFLCASISSVNSIFGCTMARQSLSDFDETEYVFIGEVIGYTKPVKFAKLSNDAYGLIVKVKESVYLPKTPKTYFEVFPVTLWADCSEGGTAIDKLKKDFKIGSEIRVIAKAAEILPNDLPDDNIRLEERPGGLGSIALNYDENNKRMTSIDSVFNYKSFKYDMNKDSESKFFLPGFETRKDLFRLKNSRTQKERTDILNRLRDMPICCNDIDFQVILSKYTSAK